MSFKKRLWTFSCWNFRLSVKERGLTFKLYSKLVSLAWDCVFMIYAILRFRRPVVLILLCCRFKILIIQSQKCFPLACSSWIKNLEPLFELYEFIFCYFRMLTTLCFIGDGEEIQCKTKNYALLIRDKHIYCFAWGSDLCCSMVLQAYVKCMKDLNLSIVEIWQFYMLLCFEEAIFVIHGWYQWHHRQFQCIVVKFWS